MNILILGGCGFIGSNLTPLLAKQNNITVFDAQWFGNYLSVDENVKIIQGDIRDIDSIPFDGIEVIIHLANIANDPGVELNPNLSWEVNVLATQQIADRAVRYGVKQIIFASSGSVYGVKSEPEVTEDLELTPISVYNKTKMVAERVLMSYQDQLRVHCIRPATVCGISPRMRLDVSVNQLTFQALKNGVITVFGGEQIRPNVHMIDITGAFKHFLDNPDLPNGAYNAGFENVSISDLAVKISEKVGAEIRYELSNDIRSYRQNSNKLLKTGFSPVAGIDQAIEEMIQKFGKGELEDRDSWYTVKTMANLGLSG